MLFCRDHGDGSALGIVLPLGAGGEFGEGGEEAFIDELLKAGGRLEVGGLVLGQGGVCLLYTSPSPRDKRQSRMPSSA